MVQNVGTVESHIADYQRMIDSLQVWCGVCMFVCVSACLCVCLCVLCLCVCVCVCVCLDH